MNLVSRAGNIVRTPRREWPVIAAEPVTIGELYGSYVMIVAAIPLLAELVHSVALGEPFGAAIGIALAGYLMTLVDVAIVAFVATRLAPKFGGVDDPAQAFKLAGYGHTAVWLGGIFLLLPWIGGLLQLASGIYSAYTFYLGIPELMRVPPQRSRAYFAVVLVLTILLAAVIAVFIGLATGVSRLLAVH